MLKLSALAGVVVAATIIPVTTFAGVTARSVSGDVMNLPMNLEELDNPQTTSLYSSNNKRIAYFYQENRQDVPLDAISENMREAIISIEDNRFYEHGALDLKGTMRAAFNNATDGSTQGGSSITQQLAKLSTLQAATTDEERQAATEVSVARKVRELKIAMNLEEKYTKDEILEKYLNIAYYGDGAYGINAAASRFFSVSPEDLTVKQAATLAGLVRNPVEYNPRKYPERAIQRRNTVLSVMATLGKIDKDEATKLAAEPLDLKFTKFPNGCTASTAAWSCDYIRRYLLADEDLGKTVAERQNLLERGGLRINTNIDMRMQDAVNNAVTSTVGAKDKAIGALALVEPGTGKVRALGQSRPMGRDTDKGQTFLNFTVPKKYGDAGGFPAGSTFKIFAVVAALEDGVPPSTAFSSPPKITMPAGTYTDCEGGKTDEWEPGNSTRGGNVDMVRATRLSVNTYFAQLEAEAGLCNTVKAAESMGINVPFPTEDNPKGLNNQVPAFVLGVTNVSPLDMAAAYATPAAGGRYCEPMPVNEILDRAGNLIKKYEPQCKQVMSEETAAEVADILTGLQKPGGYGHNRGSGLNIPSAAKTGTTQDAKAVWYAGFTPEISAASMIAGVTAKGLPNTLVGTAIKGRGVVYDATGAGLSSPMWKLAMGVIQDYLTPAPFDTPPPSSYWRAKAAEREERLGRKIGDLPGVRAVRTYSRPAPAPSASTTPEGDDDAETADDEGDDD